MNTNRNCFLLLIIALFSILFFFLNRQPVAGVSLQQEQALPPITNIAQVAAGEDHTCAVTTTGGVKCWGNNVFGQLGDSTTVARSAPVDVIGLGSGVSAIAAGRHHTCAVTTSGGVKCWGWNSSGQLGDGTTVSRTTPVDVADTGNGVVAVTAQYDHTCALITGGSVVCWGSNTYGQLGDNSDANRLTPTNVVGLPDAIRAISAGTTHTCALTINSTAWCWGDNSNGELGDGSTTRRTTPVLAVGLDSHVNAIVLGYEYTCAVVTNSTVKCWGYNSIGQLGDGTTNDSITPVAVVGLEGNIRSITANFYHVCAVTGNGNTKCWGANYSGRLGDGTNIHRTTPVGVLGLTASIRAVSAGTTHTCAVTSDGALFCWGSNAFGQLGYGVPSHLTPQIVPGLNSNARSLTAGSSHTCALTAKDVQCWGSNYNGMLGDGSTISQMIPTTVQGLDGSVRSVAAGDDHTCAITGAGQVECWGANNDGQLGDGTTTMRTTPVEVIGLGDVTALAADDYHTCAVTNNGGVQCWGYNGSGQLGDDTTITRLTPVNVVGLGSTIRAITAGSAHTCALTTNGGVKCWGSNAYGQLGDGTTIERTTPVDVIGLGSGVSAIAADGIHTCAVLDSGGVKCWGENSRGELGDGTTVNRTAPTDVVGLSSGAAGIDVGFSHSCVVMNSGGVKCWGPSNYYGQLGDGTTISKTTPVDVINLTDASAINVGYSHSCAVTTAGAVKCWGDNGSGQLGNGHAWRTTAVAVIDPTAPTPTPTATATATPTVATPTPTATFTPQPVDNYEPDDTCPAARPIPIDGSQQTHVFHQAADVDWARFDATANTTYRVEALIPADSPADVSLEVYAACDTLPNNLSNPTFTPGVRLDLKPAANGPVLLRLSSQNGVGGGQALYQLSVRPLAGQPNSGAVIIVAGRLKTDDPLQRNIHNVTKRVYTIFQTQGYTNDDIYYLATDSALPGYDAAATKENLRSAITQWATSKVELGQALTLYLMDHGEQDKFYLDGANNIIISPTELNEWLTIFENAVPTAKVNVIVEACFIGSFIAQPNSMSKPNRVVITSSDSNWSAYASPDGAHFSDHFLTALQQGRNLFTSFSEAQSQVNRRFSYQNPWLDANGDGTSNQQADFAIAAERGFAYAGTLSDDSWPPFIVTATGPAVIENRRGLLRAEVRDDKGVASVWATIYAPSYTPPTNAQELLAETAPTLLLNAQSNDRYAVEYPAFDEVGNYRIVFAAKDELGNLARTVEIIVSVGHRLLLPVIAR